MSNPITVNPFYRMIYWTTTSNSYPVNGCAAVVLISLIGIFGHKGYEYIQIGLIWQALVEILYGVIMLITGLWQATIFLNKYIYYRGMKEFGHTPNPQLHGVRNEFKNKD